METKKKAGIISSESTTVHQHIREIAEMTMMTKKRGRPKRKRRRTTQALHR